MSRQFRCIYVNEGREEEEGRDEFTGVCVWEGVYTPSALGRWVYGGVPFFIIKKKKDK